MRLETEITKNGILFAFSYYLVKDGAIFSVINGGYSQEEKAEIRKHLKSDRDVVRLEFINQS